MNKLSVHYDHKAFSAEENAVIARALEFSIKAHAEQKRATGDPYVIHPIAVAEIVAEWGLGSDVIAAALLHDVVEDTEMTTHDIEKEFGAKISELVNGLTKLDLATSPQSAPDSVRVEHNNENLRKLLLAATKDFRVMLIKLADRLHNMRTLNALSDEKRSRIAWESLAVYAPLADRLGMGQLKGELEDLGFAHASPEEYAKLHKQVDQVMRNSKTYLNSLKRAIMRHMKAGGVEVVQIEARQKHYYSIYKKLVKTDGDIDKIYDLMAVRLIVPDVAACYQALGILHQYYKPLIYRIKDYIAVPKPNGYQSLHTTVFGEDGHISEIQIRTPEMHQAAEFGLAAHFYYDSHKETSSYAKRRPAVSLPTSLSWVTELAQLRRATGSGEEFVERARMELFAGRIFVFSPKGDLYDLPEGATPLDFAFAVHSNIGLRAMGARVNGRHVPLDARLENRDVVEITTRREAAPSRDWLALVVTSHAKSRIRAWFRAASHDANVTAGRVALEQELQTWGVKRLEDLPKVAMARAVDELHLRGPEDMYALLGEGSLTLMQAIRRLVPDAGRPKGVTVVKRKEPTGRVLVEKSELPYMLAPCCSPVFPEVLIGYVTRGKGVTVHALGCRNVPVDPERYVNCRWETADDGAEMLVCRIMVKAANRFGLLSDLTGAVAKSNLNMGNIYSQISEGEESIYVEFVVEVPDLFVLAKLMRSLGRLPGISRVSRISP